MRVDAEMAVQKRPGEEVNMAWAVEVLLDEMGVWEGKLGVRVGREQRWAVVEVEKGRVQRAFSEVEETLKIPHPGEVKHA